MARTGHQKQQEKTLKKTVAESVQGVLRDPDYGREIRASYAKKLEGIQATKAKRAISLAALKKKYSG